jgi:hypothetical protein
MAKTRIRVIVHEREAEAPVTTFERIREIFLRPQDRYRLDEVERLLGCSANELLASVAHGDISLEADGDVPRVPWEELAVAAAERWPQEVIEDALGNEVMTVVPELVQLADLKVRVPLYGLVVAGRVAQRDGTTVSNVVARQLLDLAVSESAALESSVPSLDAALRWPLR